MGRVFVAYRNHPRHLNLFGKTLNQETLGRWLGLTQAQVSKIEHSSRPETRLDVLIGWAKVLQLPPDMLWFDMPNQSRFASNHQDRQESKAPSVLSDVENLEREILGSDTTADAVDRLYRAAVALAEAHNQAPARRVLGEVLRVHGQARKLLQGRQRLSQKRELFRVESALLAHACLLLGDVAENDVAERCGLLALTFANEAGSCSAVARSALAKTLRWAKRLAESADMAKLGYQASPATPIRVQLASQEANAAALLGDKSQAREALQRAERTAQEVDPDSGTSVWSFPAGRQAIFALSVAMYTGDPDAALKAAAAADAGWASGEPMVAANWAQIRVGAGIAHLLKGSLDGVVEEVTPVLDLAPELRVSTVTGYMVNLDTRLRHPRLCGNRTASELRERIRVFNQQALPAESV